MLMLGLISNMSEIEFHFEEFKQYKVHENIRLKLRVYHAKRKTRQEDSNGQNDCVPESQSATACSEIRVL